MSPAELLRIEYISKLDNAPRDFYLYLPSGYHNDEAKQWPVILFLHGNGERGNGNTELEWVLMHGPLYEAWVQKRNLPFIIISPQLPMLGMDTIPYIKNRNSDHIPKRLEGGVPPRQENFSTQDEMIGSISNDQFPYTLLPSGWEVVEDDILAIVNEVRSSFRSDENRIYLTGLSYGGFGTWYFGSRFAGIWAGIAPIAGWGHPELMDSVAESHLPVWAFAGGRDQVIKREFFYPGLNKLENLGHKEVRFTVHEDLGHDVWKRVYAGEDIYRWMLEHRKP